MQYQAFADGTQIYLFLLRQLNSCSESIVHSVKGCIIMVYRQLNDDLTQILVLTSNNFHLDIGSISKGIEDRAIEPSPII